MCLWALLIFNKNQTKYIVFGSIPGSILKSFGKKQRNFGTEIGTKNPPFSADVRLGRRTRAAFQMRYIIFKVFIRKYVIFIFYYTKNKNYKLLYILYI